MIGLRTGLALGLRTGLATGIGADALTAGTNAMAGVTKDVTSGIYIPQNSSEWTIALAAAGISSGGPSALWLTDGVASGNIPDAIGAFTATASGTGLGYQQAVTGWSTRAATTTNGSTGKFFNTSASLPDGISASVTTIAYVNVQTVTTATRTILRNVNTTAMEAEVTTTPRSRVVVGAANALGTVSPLGQVRPWVIKHNFTGSAQALYTDQEKVVPAFTALSGKLISIGAGAGSGATAQYLYVAHFFNTAAEFSDAQVKTLLQTLGWTIPWS